MAVARGCELGARGPNGPGSRRRGRQARAQRSAWSDTEPDTDRERTQRAQGGARHRERWAPTRAPGPNTESAGTRHRKRRRVREPTQRAPGPNTECRTESAGPRYRERWVPTCIESARDRHGERRAPTHRAHDSHEHEITQYAIRKKQSLQLFSPCISAHTVWGLCWYNFNQSSLDESVIAFPCSDMPFDAKRLTHQPITPVK